MDTVVPIFVSVTLTLAMFSPLLAQAATFPNVRKTKSRLLQVTDGVEWG